MLTLISKAAKDIDTESTQNRRLKPCRLNVLAPPVQRTPANIRINLYCLKLESMMNIFAVDSLSLSLLGFTQLFSKITQKI